MQTNSNQQAARFSRTKIVATIGPASESLGQLKALIQAGVDVFRLNMAHGSQDEHLVRLKNIRQAVAETGCLVAVLADLAGPKIRLGELPGGQMECLPGAKVRFIRGMVIRNQGELTCTYEPLVDELAVGDRIMLADGTVSMIVEKKETDHVECRVVQPGLLRSRQGVNLPGVKLSVPTVGPIDKSNAIWAARNGIDFLGMSFVRTAADIVNLKAILATEKVSAHIIAKIEKPEALERLADIVAAADGVMVARGDLGVETEISEVALAQKRIVTECNRQHKPVIIATQMLDSMQNNMLPTRAEVADVTNAILDGADACMLSGESAIGKYPLESVAMMHRIAVAAELIRPRHLPTAAEPAIEETMGNSITQAIVDAVGDVAQKVDAKTVIVASASGKTALALSKKRNFVPTVGVSNSESTLRRMCLYWGVLPLSGAPVDDKIALLEYVTQRGLHNGYLHSGDRVVLIAGTGLSASAHNAIVVHEI